jgi:uncharacterized membrane protein YjgN (DUF898 family)
LRQLRATIKEDDGSMTTPEGTTVSGEPQVSPVYEGAAGNVAGIAIANGLLGLLTLGFYRFWGKTRLRRYLWSHLTFEGDSLEYTGTGMELFVGFLVAMAFLMPLGILNGMFEFAFSDNNTLLAVSQAVQVLLILFLIQVAIFRARRYRLTRTQWRGIRGGQSGSAMQYALMALGWTFVSLISLGLAVPVQRTRLQRYRLEHTWLGDRSFAFDARAGQLFRRWLLTWLLFLPTLGLMYFWYRVQEFRYFTAHTRYGDLEFESDLQTGRVISIGLLYFLTLAAILLVVGVAMSVMVPGLMVGLQAMTSGDEAAIESTIRTLGPIFVLVLIGLLFMIGIAFGAARLAVFVHPMLRALAHSLSIVGEADFEAILQSQQARPRRGEGLADAFDVGSI